MQSIKNYNDFLNEIFWTKFVTVNVFKQIGNIVFSIEITQNSTLTYHSQKMRNAEV